ncbi:hypothetical protein H0E87_012437, partial [Populus deltoides]
MSLLAESLLKQEKDANDVWFIDKAVQDSSCRAWKILERQNAVRFQQHHSGCTVIKSKIYQENNAKFLVHAASGQPPESGPESTSKSVRSTLDAFYRFSRPHTVTGTALSILSVSLPAIEKLPDISPLFFTGVLEAVAAALMMNIYIVGLNQLTDIETDKVNKPYLPVASGEYSVSTGVMIVTSFSIMLPLLIWKRFAFIAAMCILAVRAVIFQLAFYLHMQTHVYGRSPFFSKPLIFSTSFMSFFSVVIALFKVNGIYLFEFNFSNRGGVKAENLLVSFVFCTRFADKCVAVNKLYVQDIPDIEGDKIFGIQSFTVRLGQKWVFWTCIHYLKLLMLLPFWSEQQLPTIGANVYH